MFCLSLFFFSSQVCVEMIHLSLLASISIYDAKELNLLQAKEEKELPEYILGTVQLNRVRLDSAVPF